MSKWHEFALGVPLCALALVGCEANNFVRAYGTSESTVSTHYVVDVGPTTNTVVNAQQLAASGDVNEVEWDLPPTVTARFSDGDGITPHRPDRLIRLPYRGDGLQSFNMSDLDPDKELESLRFYDHGYCSSESQGYNFLLPVIASEFLGELEDAPRDIDGIDERGVQYFWSLVQRTSTNQTYLSPDGTGGFDNADQLEIGLAFKARSVGRVFWFCRQATVAMRMKLEFRPVFTGQDGSAELYDRTHEEYETIEGLDEYQTSSANWLAVVIRDLEIDVSGDRSCRTGARRTIANFFADKVNRTLPEALAREIVKRYLTVAPESLDLEPHECEYDIDCSPFAENGPDWPGVVWGYCASQGENQPRTCRVQRFPLRIIIGPAALEFVLAESASEAQVELTTEPECATTRRSGQPSSTAQPIQERATWVGRSNQARDEFFPEDWLPPE